MNNQNTLLGLDGTKIPSGPGEGEGMLSKLLPLRTAITTPLGSHNSASMSNPCTV